MKGAHTMGKLFRSMNRSAVCLILALASVFALISYCNFQSWLAEDDFFYCFSWLTEERITGIRDIFPSMAAHRYIQNGRVTAHFLVQLFLMLPLWIFDLLNSIIFCALLFLLYYLAKQDKPHNVMLFLSLFGSFWLFQHNISEVLFWLDGSVNYLWSAFFSVVWLTPYILEYTGGKEMSGAAKAVFCVYSLFVGGYSENSTVALICMAIAFIAAEKVSEGRVDKGRLKWKLCSVLCMLPSFLRMLLAPAEYSRKGGEMSVRFLLRNFLSISNILLRRFWILLLLYLVLFAAGIRAGRNVKLLCTSAVLFIGAMAAMYILTFASYCPERCLFIVLVLLCFACAFLAFEDFGGGIRRLLCAASAVCITATLYFGYIGVNDIRLTSYKIKYNIALVNEAKENGERAVRLPIVHPKTKYSVGYEWPYLSELTPYNFTNRQMAKYFDVDLIYGYELYE